MCEAALTKNALFVCESGHVVCEACRTAEENTTVDNSNAMRTARNESSMTTPGYEVFQKDLASGDHQRFFKCIKPKSNSTCSVKHDRKVIDNRRTFSEEGMFSSNKETSLKYKNVNFCDSDSSVSQIPSINNQEEEFPINSMQRPVICPVTDCHKIIARDAVLQHFYFDHSKVPRIKIIDSQHQEVFIQLSAITEKLQSYAVFLVSDAPLPRAASNTLMNGGYKNSSFLLMGARMPPAEVIQKPHGSESVCTRHVQTQTGAVKTKSSKVHVKVANSLKVNQDNFQKKCFCKDGAVMLWICKLGDSSFYYSISVTRPDKKLGFSVTGETTNINDSQDCYSIWNQFDCLLIREKDSEKLINKERQLEININIFK